MEGVCVCARMHVLHVWAPTEGGRRSRAAKNLSYRNYGCLVGLLGTELQSPTKAIHTVDLRSGHPIFHIDMVIKSVKKILNKKERKRKENKGRQDGSRHQPEGRSSAPGTHVVEGETWLPHAVL